MSSFRPLHRYRTLWTDFEQNRFYRTLAINAAERLARMRTRPGTSLTDLATEQTILNHAKKEAQRTNHQLNDLSRMNEQP